VIEEHPKLTPPPEDAVLWRYMDFTKFVALLEARALWFTQTKSFEDKYEGVFPKPVLDKDIQEVAKSGAPEEILTLLRGFRNWAIGASRESTYVSCWHKNDHQSAAMWKLYLKSDEGVAVRTTFRGMKAAFAKSAERVHATVVKYIDYTTDQFDADPFVVISHKRKSFQHEQEVRLIWRADVGDGLTCSLTWGGIKFEGPPGRPIPISLPDLIEEVLVAPSAPPWFHTLVATMVKRYGLDCPVSLNDFNSSPIY
jgi:hypothetical protein